MSNNSNMIPNYSNRISYNSNMIKNNSDKRYAKDTPQDLVKTVVLHRLIFEVFNYDLHTV